MLNLPLHDSEIPHVIAALELIAEKLSNSPAVADQVASCSAVSTRLRAQWLATPTDLGSL